MKYIISFYVWTFLVITAIAFFPLALCIWIVLLPFDKDRKIFHFVTTVWSSLYLINNPWWKLKIEHRDRIKKGEVYIIVSNHQSMLDILMLFQLYTSFKWVSKMEVFRTPIVGLMMRMNNYISLRRGKLASIKDMMTKCMKVLEKGYSVLIFPEGTRSADSNLSSFKEGAFKLAQKAKCNVLPVVIHGTAAAIPKKGLILQKKQTIRIRVLEPFLAKEFIHLPVKQFVALTHDKINIALNELKEYE